MCLFFVGVSLIFATTVFANPNVSFHNAYNNGVKVLTVRKSKISDGRFCYMQSKQFKDPRPPNSKFGPAWWSWNIQSEKFQHLHGKCTVENLRSFSANPQNSFQLVK